MRCGLLYGLIFVACAVALASAAHQTSPSQPAQPGRLAGDEQAAVVQEYCATCHNERLHAGSLSLASFDPSRVAAHAATAEKMIRKLRAGMMPPAGARRPDDAMLIALASALEFAIDRAAAARPDPGARPFQRMNRAEYGRAVRDLLGLDVDVAAFLPPDTISGGFDNIIDAQSFSPALLDGYLRAAGQISRLAVGDRHASAASTTYKLGRTRSQMHHVEGTPIGTRGGIAVVHVFPADGEYVFRVSLHNEPLGGLYGRSTMTAMGLKEKLEIAIEGARVAVLELNTRMNESDPANGLELSTPPMHVQAGPQRVAAAFIQNIEAPPDDLLMPTENSLADVSMSFGVTLLPHMRDFTIAGPYRVTGVSDTIPRRRIFTCRPTAAAEETACAEQIVRRLATQAYRGRVTDEDVRELMAFYERGRQDGDFEEGIRLALQATLASPRFLFRLERPSRAVRPGEPYPVSAPDLATRLSFFLWGTGPDAPLRKAAAAGTLATAAGLERQVRRMLADPRSEALATRFASQWLRLQDLDRIIPDYLQYPHYDSTLAASMKRETELLFDHLVREDRSVLELVTADYSFVNERLARHYGIPGVVGNEFRRVALPENRRGILGHGSILTLTSLAERTSPVLRGKWIMEVLLGSPPPPPPPDVPDLEETSGVKDGRLLSVRARMEEHRKNPACTSCHRVIDPLGLALENYDSTGAWRMRDNGMPVDATGNLYDGTPLSGPADLRAALLRRQDVLLQTFTANLLAYAVGRRVEHHDMPAVRAIVRSAARREYRMSAFLRGVVASAPFRMNRDDAAEPDVLTSDGRDGARVGPR